MSLVKLAMGTRGWFGESAVTLRLGMANAALSCVGHGRTVSTGAEVVVVVPPMVVVVDPGIVEVVDVLEVVVVEAEPVGEVTRSKGSATATATENTNRPVSRDDGREGTFIVHENIGTSKEST